MLLRKIGHWTVHLTLHGVLWTMAFLMLAVLSEDVYPSSFRLSVSATVIKKVWVRVVSAPRGLTLTPEHVRQGWVDVAEPTVLLVRNNSEDGFGLEVSPDPRLVSEVVITRLPSYGQAVVAGGAGLIQQTGRFPVDTRMELKWRLRLSPEATAGEYPWPIQMQAQTL